MNVLGTLKYKREIFRHGGTEVLRLEVLTPDVPSVNDDRPDRTDEKQKISGHGVKNRQKRRREKTVARSGASLPPGESEAVRHLAALVLELENFVRENVVPEAERDLDAAVTAGCGYRFARYLCRIACEEQKRHGKAELTVRFLVTSGGQTRHEAQLCSVWSADGNLQYRPRRHDGKAPRMSGKHTRTKPGQSNRKPQPLTKAETAEQSQHSTDGENAGR